MNVLDLFSGIGGFSLGLERAGMRTVAFCEIKPFARRVLAKHWPDVPRYNDVRSLSAARLAADGIAPDIICGGFPCQNVSIAATVHGGHTSLDGEQSGLWFEYARLIEEIQPKAAIIENVEVWLGQHCRPVRYPSRGVQMSVLEEMRHLDGVRKQRQAAIDDARAIAVRNGKSHTFIDTDGCEVTVRPDGVYFYNMSDWY